MDDSSPFLCAVPTQKSCPRSASDTAALSRCRYSITQKGSLMSLGVELDFLAEESERMEHCRQHTHVYVCPDEKNYIIKMFH